MALASSTEAPGLPITATFLLSSEHDSTPFSCSDWYTCIASFNMIELVHVSHVQEYHCLNSTCMWNATVPEAAPCIPVHYTAHCSALSKTNLQVALHRSHTTRTATTCDNAVIARGYRTQLVA